MGRCLLLVIVLMSFSNSSAQEDLSAEVTTKHFAIHNHFWLNLHHFLQAVVEDRESLTDSLKLKPEFKDAIGFYHTNLKGKDLRRNGYQYNFKNWIIQVSDSEGVLVPDYFVEHYRILRNVADLYRTHIWPDHKAANLKSIEENLALIEKTEDQAVARLSKLTRSNWQEAAIRVDVCFVSKPPPFQSRGNVPYTTTRNGTHIVMCSQNNAEPGNWLELLYHEASHHLIDSKSGFVGGTIRDFEATSGLSCPRDLWHATLFYFSGIVTRELLLKNGFNDYDLYMFRERVFHWLFPLLQTHLPPYIEGQTSFYESIAALTNAFGEAGEKKGN